MRIAMFSDNFYPELSGISDSLTTTVSSLAKLGHTVRIYAPEYSAKNFSIACLSQREIFLGERVSVCRLPSMPFPTGTKQSRLVLPLGFCLRDLKTFQPDILHTHQMFGVGLEALLAKKLFKVPLVGTNHTAITEFVRYAPIKVRWLEGLSLRYLNWYYGKCAFVSAPSQSVLDEMEKGGFDVKSGVVSNPVDLDAFNDFSDSTGRQKADLKKKFGVSDETIVYAGRFAPEKNIEVIVHAVALAKKEKPAICLAMAGHGVSSESIRRLVKELDLEENVRFVGTLDRFKLADLYRASEIFVITSTSETQSMTLIQSMACALPAIGVRARALPEYINEKNGALVEPGDCEGIARQIVSWLDDPGEMGRLGQGGKDSIRKFSADNVASRWEMIYKEVRLNF